MLLNNQKYLVVHYEFSSDFSDYLASITSFIYKLIRTYNDANLNENLLNIVVPTDVDKFLYYEEHDNNELQNFIKSFIEVKLQNQLKNNKDVIFQFKNLIVYSENKKSILRKFEQSDCSTRNVYDITFKKLSHQLNVENLLKPKILEFWELKVDSLTFEILKKYIEEKTNLSEILVAGKSYYSDFLPVLVTQFNDDDKLMYDSDNKISLNSKIIDRFFEKTNIEIHDENDLAVDKVNYIAEDVEEIGLFINNQVYVFDFYKNRSRLQVTQKMLFEYFKHSIKVDFEKKSNDIIDFSNIRQKNKDEKLTTILAKLENNLHLEKIKFEDLDSEIQDFFQTSYLIQNKEFEHFHLFVANQETENKFLLGIVNNSNERLHDGSGVKGLKCWIDKESKEIKSFENYESIKNASQLVCHLSPEYAFYYKEKFFEDYLEDILTDIKAEKPEFHLEYITNNKFYFSNSYNEDSPLEAKYQNGKVEQEFDIIVSIEKNGISKNVVLEAKTKLTKYIADEQRKKVQKYIKHDNLKIFDDYLLIGFNHDNTMEDLMYFQKKYPIVSSNDNIEISFRYPLPATEDKVIYCMASTNYILLKEALINFFNTELYA